MRIYLWLVNKQDKHYRPFYLQQSITKFPSQSMYKFTKLNEYHKIWDEEYMNGMSAT